MPVTETTKLDIPEECQMRSTIAWLTICAVLEDFTKQLAASSEDLTSGVRDNVIDGVSVIALSAAGSYFNQIKIRLMENPIPSKHTPIDLVYEHLVMIGTVGSMIKMISDPSLGGMIVKVAEGTHVSDAEAKKALAKSEYGRNILNHIQKEMKQNKAS